MVIATGGGAVVADDAWGARHARRAGTLVIALDASPETMLARLQRQAADEGDAVERPLLAGDDPLARIRELKSAEAVALRQGAPDHVVGRDLR